MTEPRTDADIQYAMGDRVEHDKFGAGTVVYSHLSGAVVEFDSGKRGNFGLGRKFIKPSDVPRPEKKTSEQAKPAAANDNKPGELDIFAWKSSRFVGEPAPVEYLVNGVIESGIPGMIAAQGEVGKSFTMLELSRRVAFGTKGNLPPPPIFGGQVVQEGTAVLLAGEDDARAMHRRLAALDPKGSRLAEKGDKLIAIPLPSAVKAIQPFWRVVKGELVETPSWRQFCDNLDKVSDLRLVTIDPLQLFAAVPLNEDPAAGQFVCGSIASLAAHTGANVFFAHHMAKRVKGIVTLGDARDAIRGTSALVDGVRLAYGLWYGETDKARKICKTIGVPYEPNRIVHGGVVKANGAARLVIRSDEGHLVSRPTSALTFMESLQYVRGRSKTGLGERMLARLWSLAVSIARGLRDRAVDIVFWCVTGFAVFALVTSISSIWVLSVYRVNEEFKTSPTFLGAVSTIFVSIIRPTATTAYDRALATEVANVLIFSLSIMAIFAGSLYIFKERRTVQLELPYNERKFTTNDDLLNSHTVPVMDQYYASASHVYIISGDYDWLFSVQNAVIAKRLRDLVLKGNAHLVSYKTPEDTFLRWKNYEQSKQYLDLFKRITYNCPLKLKASLVQQRNGMYSFIFLSNVDEESRYSRPALHHYKIFEYRSRGVGVALLNNIQNLIIPIAAKPQRNNSTQKRVAAIESDDWWG